VVRFSTVAMQGRSKYASKIIEGLCFLRSPCLGVTLKTTGATQLVESRAVQGTLRRDGAVVQLTVQLRDIRRTTTT
jgi:hypothetical protein